MRTIKLATAYQLVFTSLLLGACLGTVSQRVPERFTIPLSSVQAKAVTEEQAALDVPSQSIGSSLPTDLALTTNQGEDANVQVEVEVHTTRGANASARAIGPGDTVVKTDTTGEGHGRAVARLDAPTSPTWPAVVSSADTSGANGVSTSSDVVPAGYADNGAPLAIIQESLVNLRSAPGLYGAVMGSGVRGQGMKVIGRDRTGGWWLVCCVNEQTVWISASVVTIMGSTSEIHIVNAAAPTNGAVASPVAMAGRTGLQTLPASAAPIPIPEYPFELTEQQQHAEQIIPRIHLYVHDGSEGLGNYSVRVHKDGATLAVEGQTFAGTPGYTWPLPTERQHFTNLKLEFPHISVAGQWDIQLIDGAGKPVGPPARFILAPNDPNQEMYVRYERR